MMSAKRKCKVSQVFVVASLSNRVILISVTAKSCNSSFPYVDFQMQEITGARRSPTSVLQPPSHSIKTPNKRNSSSTRVQDAETSKWNPLIF